MLKITHAAGHWKSLSGDGYKESPDGFKEWSYTNEIVKLVIAELSKYEDVSQKRIDDATGKVDKPLDKRTDEINAWGAHLHIDYHLNAFGRGWNTAGGTETYVYTTRPTKAVSLATKVQNNLVKELGFANRGVKDANFHMVRETKMTAILIEFAFMTNKNEAMKMRTLEYQKKAAKAVVDALVLEHGLKRKPEPKPAPKSDVLYKVQVGAFSSKENAEAFAKRVEAEGFGTFIVEEAK
jgi:N-acetylmuramoyl-L-alanine amidase